MHRFISALIGFVVVWILTWSFPLYESLISNLFILYIFISILLIVFRRYELFLFINIFLVQFNTHFNYYNQLSILSILSLFLIYIFFQNKCYKSKSSLWLLLFIVYSFLVSITKVEMINILLSMTMFNFLFVIAIFKEINISEQFVKTLVFVPFILIPISIYQLIYHPEIGFDLERLGGPVFQANGYAILLNQYIILNIAFYLSTRKNIFILLTGIYVFLVVMTFSRSGFYTLLISLFVIVSLHFGKGRLKISLFFPVVLLLILMYMIFSSNLLEGTRLVDVSQEDLQTNRIYIWESIWQLISNNFLFGIGLGGYGSIQDRVIYGLTTHNTYLQYIVNIGIVGLILFVLFLYYTLRRMYLFFRRNYGRISMFEKVILESAITSLVLLMLSGFTASWSFSLYTSFLVFVLVGHSHRIIKKYELVNTSK